MKANIGKEYLMNLLIAYSYFSKENFRDVLNEVSYIDKLKYVLDQCSTYRTSNIELIN